MHITRLFLVGLTATAVASCAPQAPAAAPAPVAAAPGAAGFPFQVPEGAQFVARSRGASNIYRIQEGCAALEGMKAEHVVFFWTLDAARRSGFHLSEDEGCS